MSVQAPGSVSFDEDEAWLIEAANVMLMTGWSYADYLDTPLDVIDAVKQVREAQDEVKAWHMRRAQQKRKR